jgi:hypothetical protein
LCLADGHGDAEWMRKQMQIVHADTDADRIVTSKHLICGYT